MRRSEILNYQALAETVATRSTMRHKVGCVIVDTDRRHTCTYNRYLGDPQGKGWSLHAEAWGVLRAEDYWMQPTVAFVARHNGRLAKPCPRCMEALEDAGIKTVYYTYAPGEWAVEDIG